MKTKSGGITTDMMGARVMVTMGTDPAGMSRYMRDGGHKELCFPWALLGKVGIVRAVFKDEGALTLTVELEEDGTFLDIAAKFVNGRVNIFQAALK
jgi:hypothetical protein